MENTTLRRRSHPGLYTAAKERPVQEVDHVSKKNPRDESAKSRSSTLTVVTAIFLLVLFSLFMASTWSPELFYTLFSATERIKVDRTSASARHLDMHLYPHNHIFREQQVLEFEWNITAGYRRPDGVKKRIFLINNEFPGPTVEAHSGDSIRLYVRNGLDKQEHIGLHFHGLHMRNANDMDGAVGLTQCGIRPNETFVYEFKISEGQHGTFWYHAHDQVQRADGLFGAFIVHPANESTAMALESFFPPYDEERLLLVGDWYHRSADDVLSWYMRSGSFGNEPVPDSMVVNGQGAFDCSDAVPSRPVDCNKDYSSKKPYIRLNSRKRYRFRIINTGTLAGFTFNMPDALLTLITVDGGHPAASDQAVQSIGTLYPGERMDVVVQIRDGHRGTSSSVNFLLDNENFKYPNPSLTLNQTFPVIFDEPSEEVQSTSGSFSETVLSLESITRPKESSRPPFPDEADLTLVVYATTLKLSRLSNVPHGFMNHTSWKPQAEPPLPLLLLPRARWDEHQFVPFIRRPTQAALWIDVVINNLDDGSHPFHLHGHDFYVLSIHSGGDTYWGSFNPFDSSESPPGGPFNLANPIKKDTVFVPRRGYTVIRFLADNEGIWMFHCHILWHQASGMSMAFQVSKENLSEEALLSMLTLSKVEQLRSSCRI